MSFTQKEIISQIMNWQRRKDVEIAELGRMTRRFSESERTKKAREIAFSEKLEETRDRFSQFFSRQPVEGSHENY